MTVITDKRIILSGSTDPLGNLGWSDVADTVIPWTSLGSPLPFTIESNNALDDVADPGGYAHCVEVRYITEDWRREKIWVTLRGTTPTAEEAVTGAPLPPMRYVLDMRVVMFGTGIYDGSQVFGGGRSNRGEIRARLGGLEVSKIAVGRGRTQNCFWVTGANENLRLTKANVYAADVATMVPISAFIATAQAGRPLQMENRLTNNAEAATESIDLPPKHVITIRVQSYGIVGASMHLDYL